MIRFLHGSRQITLDGREGDSTILDYLREDVSGRGTKEGCASGDCGACTVVVAEACGDALRYRPVNACIAPLGGLHGRQLITVENLASDGTLHPVQAAMVHCHGSQCGFCTPGFVMSLFALYKRAAPEPLTHAEVCEALGGNLCRCTGYRPIIAAAQAAADRPRPDAFSDSESATCTALAAIAADCQEPASLAGEISRYVRPGSLRDLQAILDRHPDARLIAGGTDLMLEATQGLARLPLLLDLSAIPELTQVTRDDRSLTLGAAATHEAIREVILDDYPELAELIERFGSRQIRSQGTLGGNVANASPVGDWPPVLLALEASLELEGPQGARSLPLYDFFLAYRRTALLPREIIRAVTLPRRTPELFLRAYKISKRFEDDISSVCAVFALHLDGPQVIEARAAFGGMDAIPRRAGEVEAALTGSTLDADAIDAAARAMTSAFTPISDARASADYRQRVATKLLTRLQLEFMGQTDTRSHGAHGGSVTHG